MTEEERKARQKTPRSPWDNLHLLNPWRYEHFMLDFETYDTRAWSAAISSVACMQFHPVPAIMTGRNPAIFNTAVRLPQPGRTIDEDTVIWREKNGIAELEKAMPQCSLPTMLKKLNSFFVYHCSKFGQLHPPAENHGVKQMVLWSKPLSFDVVLLAQALDAAQIQPLWHYRNACDVNTWCTAHGFDPLSLLYLEIEKMKDRGENVLAHDPITDCRIQIAMLHACLKDRSMEKAPEDNEPGGAFDTGAL